MNHLSIKLLRKKVFYQIKTLCVEGCDFIALLQWGHFNVLSSNRQPAGQPWLSPGPQLTSSTPE